LRLVQHNRILDLRVSKQVSQRKLAEALGVTESTISRWETGKQGIPDWRKQQIAEFFSVSVTYLMRWDDWPRWCDTCEAWGNHSPDDHGPDRHPRVASP
jgi:transcriptional regulator with XRE-family HTH domain